jgi:hypothetical protein
VRAAGPLGGAGLLLGLGLGAFELVELALELSELLLRVGHEVGLLGYGRGLVLLDDDLDVSVLDQS